MKLNPPYIDGALPSFYKSADLGTVSLTVPFSMNKSVSDLSVGGFSVKLKTIQTDALICTLSTNVYDLVEKTATFTIPANIVNTMRVGQYYKLQLAYQYAGTNEVGYYSTVGVIKYTAKPTVYIDGLVAGNSNFHQYSYVGVYNNTDDTTEKEYQYRFIIYDSNWNIIKDTGYLVHNNSANDKINESYDSYNLASEIIDKDNYYIQYCVITNNNMEVSSYKYQLIQNQQMVIENVITIIPTMIFDEGYVDVQLQGKRNSQGSERSILGKFLVCRSCSDTGYTVWEEMLRFSLLMAQPSSQSFKDFTVEQGKSYIYSIQQYNDYNLYTEKQTSIPVFADFEDMFLYDGEKQLKIKFNPKVSSFKTDLLEQKMDTIGSKYPFIFRNGSVEYKEFPLSGLISYQADIANLFINDKDIGLTNEYLAKSTSRGRTPHAGTTTTDLIRTTNLVGYNFSAERDFKLAVLDWLNNGKVKLFRSPAEGNYLVRLMNVSLAPFDDKISRLLHTFNATAYEVSDYNYNQMIDSSIIVVDQTAQYSTQWMTVDVNDLTYQDNFIADHPAALELSITDAQPGAEYIITFKYSGTTNILIGPTGSYSILSSDNPIISVKLRDNNNYWRHGSLTYAYDDRIQYTHSLFNRINNVEFIGVPVRQFIGSYDNLITEIEEYLPKSNEKITSLLAFTQLRFTARTLVKGHRSSPTSWLENVQGRLVPLTVVDSQGKMKPLMAEYNNIDPFTVFYDDEVSDLLEEKNGLYTVFYDPHYEGDKIIVDQASYDKLSNANKKKCIVYNSKIYINDNEIDISETGYYDIDGEILFNKIAITEGVIAECSYKLQRIEYNITSNAALIAAQEAEEENNEIIAAIVSSTPEKTPEYYDELEEAREQAPILRQAYLDALDDVLAEIKEEEYSNDV